MPSSDMQPLIPPGTSDDDFEPVLLRQRPRESADMDITPMIDITFLLLIFFLVCSSLDQSAEIEMAEARYGTAVSERNATIVSIDVADPTERKAIVYLGDGATGEPLPDDPRAQEEEVRTAVEAAYADGRSIVVVKAHQAAKCEDVARIASAAGLIEGIHLHYGVLEADK